MQRACQITDKIFSEIIHNFHFKTEREIYYCIKKRFREFRVRQAYPPIVANNSAVIHQKPRRRRLQHGFLILDFAAKVNGYCTDMTRTIFIGKANADERKLYNTVLQCQKKIYAQVRPGVACCDLDINARVLLGTYKRYFLHALGHGVGKKVHERPTIRPTSQDILKTGDVVAIEPGIYIKEKDRELGIRIEDTLYIARKPVILSRSPKKLLEVALP